MRRSAPHHRLSGAWLAALVIVAMTTISAVVRADDVNPCMTPDPGWGVYDHWSRNVSMGQLIAPQKGGITSSGGFDLIVHFHGHYPIRKEFVKTANGIVLVAIDLGVSSGPYTQAFASPQAFEHLLASVEEEMKRRTGREKVHIRKLGLSSWSAGYGAIQQILKQKAGKKVDALILLDSVHAGYENPSAKTLKEAQLEPFIDFAKLAAKGRKFMFQSHSSIIPPGFASTQEVSHFMVNAIGGKLRKANRSDVLGLSMFERFDKGNYHVRGYTGNDKPDHCAHLGLMKDVIKVHINRRWNPPKGKRGKRAVDKAKVAARAQGRTYVVKSGDTLTGIASRHDVSVQALRRENGLTKGRPIRVGQELVVPASDSGKGSSKRKDEPAPKKSVKPGERVHVVARGEALIPIAKKYGVTVSDIRDRNGLSRGGRRIQPGDELVIPRPKP
ncbi:MAG: LysM peptidoglycan-binding domain-containing protein [Polyangiaceae bacterium]